MNTINITTSQNIELEYELGSLGDRIISRILDRLLLLGYLILVVSVTGFENVQKFMVKNLWFLAIFIALPLLFYHLLSEMFLNGQSLGKRIMGIKVISLTGGQPTFSQYLTRWIFRIVDFVFSGGLVALIMVAVSEKKQRLGDVVGGTILVKTRPRTQIADTLFHEVQGDHYEVMYPEVINLKDQDIELIKEVLRSVNRSGNILLAFQAQQKIELALNIRSRHNDAKIFLHTLLVDYNFITSRL